MMLDSIRIGYKVCRNMFSEDSFAYLLLFSFLTDVKLIEYLHSNTKCFTLIKLIILVCR